MNIYRARQIQKELIKQSDSDATKTRTYLHKGMLFYQAIHQISPNNNFCFGDTKRINQLLEMGIKVTYSYIQACNDWNLPVGMYALEAIPID